MNPRIIVIALIAFGAYVLGARAGKGRYTEIKHAALGIWNDPHAKKARKKVSKASHKEGKRLARAAKKKRAELFSH